ncbi:hypothetical protein GJ496_000343 [Pomphorhynchus laevis]|nr:hypothetical protein GJ496_000343 [Pomphorhynchus laevis]
MQRIYNENPKFREEIAVDEKLKTTNIDISDLNQSIARCSEAKFSSCSNCEDQQTVLVSGTDCSDNRNQTNFTIVDNGLNDVRTSDVNATDLPGEYEEEPTTTYIGSALAVHYFSSEGFGEGIISMSAGEEMMTIEAHDYGKTKVENAIGKKRNAKLDVDESSDDEISLHVIEDEEDDVNRNSDKDDNEDDSGQEERSPVLGSTGDLTPTGGPNPSPAASLIEPKIHDEKVKSPLQQSRSQNGPQRGKRNWMIKWPFQKRGKGKKCPFSKGRN